MRRPAAIAGFLIAWIAAFVLAALPWPASAHKPSDSYLSLSLAAPSADGRLAVAGRWDIALRDLDYAIGLDADGDGRITWGEVRAKHAEIAGYALARLTLRRGAALCAATPGVQQLEHHTDGTYTVLPIAFTCPPPPAGGDARTPPAGGDAQAPLEVEYRLFADLDPQHRGLLNLASDGGPARTALFGPQEPVQRFEIGTGGESNGWHAFTSYLREGIRHIWIGIDHILFLLSLLLPAVLAWRQGRWLPVVRGRDAAWDVLRIVTAFTLAHSITLTIATLGWLRPPSRLVESVIAASVVVAALNNLRPLVHGRRWLVAFGFGLVHGFGFASVLADLGLPRGALALALFGFNLGVEVGQLAIVAVFLPLAFALRRTAFYRHTVFIGGSLAIAVLAAGWLAERVFDFKVLPF